MSFASSWPISPPTTVLVKKTFPTGEFPCCRIYYSKMKLQKRKKKPPYSHLSKELQFYLPKDVILSALRGLRNQQIEFTQKRYRSMPEGLLVHLYMIGSSKEVKERCSYGYSTTRC
ncbi:hypothetical protein AVEN_141933-1 [Araneus ventricosus]|uniref:Uncharacterized protein n=1 Tax=Araneus ventricosus TaxID=182803 RepID=A0A4Y2PD02_ARAVE|nr:hypothetical protein AVEN_141933-1 [Araneus ventricosus]